MRVAPKRPGITANAYFANAISQAISGGYAAVVFPTAVYEFTAPATPAQSHVSVENAKDLVIDEQGSTLDFRSPLSAGVTISNSARVIFRGFTIDWPNTLMASLGTIVSIDKRSTPRTMRVQLAPDYHVDATTRIVALSPWDAKTDPANPHFALRDFDKEQYTFNRGTVYIGNRTFEVPYYNTFIEVGDDVLVRHFGGSPYKNAVQTGGSHDIDFENVTVYASPYVGFLLTAGGGYRLSHCSVTRRDAARLISSAADAVHVSDNTGDLIIENGTFGYQGDDGLNIHGAVSGTAKAGQRFEHWSVGGEGSYAPYKWLAGDVLGFFDASFGFYGATHFRSLAHPSSGLEIDFDDPTPAGVTQIGDLSRASARFVIRNTTFSYNRARGMLLQSSLGLIENNTFTGQTAQGIVVGAASGSEGPGVQDVTFRNNRFSDVGSVRTTPLAPDAQNADGAVFVGVQGVPTTSSRPVFQNLIFDANVFRDLHGPGIYLSTANAVVISDNRFIDTNRSRVPNSAVGSATSNGSLVVTRTHNVYLANNTMSGATTGPLSVDTTSTDGVKR